jgi:hypothetical protein
LSAQQNVYYTGVGRALVTNDELKDNTKSASRLKSSGGYTLFDLGVYAKSSDVLRAGVIMRIRNEFGGFFGDGASLQFRQIQMEGLIAKRVKFDIGDIYLTHTRYTLWNEDNMYHKYESNLFSLRRSIVNYENFFVDNAWRMQGMNAHGKINFAKGIESLGIRGYAGRTRQTNFTTIPDRYFYGGKLDLTQSKYFRIGGNLAGISDIPGTVKLSDVNYQNMVYTTDFAITAEGEKFKYVLSGEVGGSNFQLSRSADSLNSKFNDYFYDGGVKAIYKPINLTFGASYRNVGFNFNSPMAQTRRVADPNNVTLNTFPLMNDGVTARPITLFDFYSQETNLYNQSISPTLMNYYIQYNIVEPYGRATPNRKGYTFNASVEDENKIITASVEANLLSEIVSEGDSITFAKRKFTSLHGGLIFNLHKVMSYEKVIAINAGYRTESSKRDGTNPVNLSNSLIDLGVDIEVFKDLHLLGGAKLFKVNGNEVQNGRNQLNQIVSFTPANFNQTQNILATGLRYDYGANGYFCLNYQSVKFTNKIIDTSLNASQTVPLTFNLHQWFFVFGLKF